MRHLLLLVLLAVSCRASALGMPCSQIDAPALQSLMTTLSKSDSDVTSRKYSKLCFRHGEGKTAYVTIDFAPVPKGGKLAVWQSVACSSNNGGKDWKCDPFEQHRQFLHNGQSIELGKGVDLDVAQRAVAAVERITREDAARLLGGKNVNAETYAELKHIRRIYYENGKLYVGAGSEDFYGYDIELAAIECGLAQCGFNAVKIRFWIS